MRLQVLTLGLRLLMTRFVCNVLIFYKVAPLSCQRWPGFTVVGLETLCDLYTPEACQREVFSTAYSLRKTTQGACYFASQSGVEKVIINMVNNDHGI